MDYPTFILGGIRNKAGRNLGTALCFALIAANIFSGQYLLGGTERSLGQGVSRTGADLLVVPLEYTMFSRGVVSGDSMAIVAVLPSGYRFGSGIMAEIGEIQGVAGVSAQLFVAPVQIPGQSPIPINVYGMDPATDFTIRPWLRNPLPHPLSTGEVLIGHGIRGEVGDTIPISGRTYTVAGLLDETQSEIDQSMFLTMEDAYDLASVEGIIPPGAPQIAAGEVNGVLVQVAPGEDPDIVAFRFNRLCTPVNATVMTRHFSLDPVTQNLQGLPIFLNTLSAIVLMAAFPLIALISAMVAHERQRELGLLRAMGAKRSIIVFLTLAESLVLASIGAAAGIGTSLALLSVLNARALLTSALQVSLRMPTATEVGVSAGVAFLVVIAMAGLASAYPAYRSGTMNPLDAINGDGKLG